MALPNFLDLYSQLIATPSISSTDRSWDSSNENVINLLALWFDELGFSTNISQVPGLEGKFNLVATLGAGPLDDIDGGLLLAGHTDTVPYDEGRWSRDPFKLQQEGNRLYGLGSIDMKGFFAFVLEACKDIDVNKLKKPLRILATADEETTMSGAKAIAASSNLKPEFAVIGEPTGLMPVHMHKGHMSEAIRVTGKSGHSSDPANGLNAIEIMHKVISSLMQLQQTLLERYQNPHFKIPQPTLNFGHIHGGDSPNRICGCCELHIDIRPLPGLKVEELYQLLNNSLSEINKIYPNAVELIHVHEGIPAYSCDLDSKLIQIAEHLTGKKAEAVNYCTEAPFIQQLGCDTIVLGPGSIDQAHQPDEYLDLSMVKPTQKVVSQLIQRFCL